MPNGLVEYDPARSPNHWLTSFYKDQIYSLTMKTTWDYTIANAYSKRPDYSQIAIDAMLSISGAKKGDNFMIWEQE